MQFSLAYPNTARPLNDLSMRDLDEPAISWHTQTKLPVLAYSPTAGGYFASGGQKAIAGYDNAVSRARLGWLEKLALEMNVSANQLALAYLVNQPFSTIPILGTSDPEHLQDALQAASVRLSGRQVQWLRNG